MGQRLGSLIGATGGMVFVLVNAGPLDQPLRLVLRMAGVVVFVLTVWFAVLRTGARIDASASPPPPQAMRTYAACVVAEVIAIPAGALILARVIHRPELTLVWVVFVVGLHFVPFARAFRVPLFNVLAVTLMTVAVVGGLVTVTLSPLGAPGTGVVAGFVLLAFAMLGVGQRPPSTRLPSRPR